MEQVVDDLGAGTLSSDFLFVGRIHVHHHRLDAPAAVLAEQLEEGPYVITAASSTEPRAPLAQWLDHDGGIATALLDRELVHPDHFHVARIGIADLIQQVGLVDRLDVVPTQAEPLRHVLDGQHAAESSHRLGQPCRHVSVPLRPFHVLEFRTVRGTADPTAVSQ